MRSQISTESHRGGAAILLALLILAGCAGQPQRGSPSAASRLPVRHGPVSDTPVKLGQPYQVAGTWYYPADDAQYDEVGFASWYGNAFHGGPTANGETFDMNMVGAAHKTLPLPCYVEVTALDTGRTIVTRVNDRGPFVPNRIIDLSRRAAEQLGVARQGVARVRVRRVYPSDADRLALRSGKAVAERPVVSRETLAALDGRFARQSALKTSEPRQPLETTIAPQIVLPAPALLSASSIGGYFVQIGAFGDRARADGLANSLGGSIESGAGVYRVRLGPYFDEDMALAALARAQGQGYQGATLIRPSVSN